MYVGNPKRLSQLEIDKPIRLNTLMQAELLLVVILCVAHEWSYVNATGETWVCLYVCMSQIMYVCLRP